MPLADRFASLRVSTLFALGPLGGVLAYSIYHEGDRGPFSWNVSLFVLAVTSIAYWALTRTGDLAPPVERRLGWLIALAPACVALQLVPLPIFLLRIVSPSRARLLDSLAGVTVAPHFAALSIDSAETFSWFLKIAAYTAMFLLARDLSARFRRRGSWAMLAPLIGVAALEAGLGLLQSASAGDVQGTYLNRNHFAGLLEMVLPIAAGYGFALLRPDPPEKERGSLLREPVSREPVAVANALNAGAMFVLAGLMLTALVYSTSKSGFIACLAGLYLMAALALWNRVDGAKRWIGIAALAALFVAIFVFLPTDQLARALTGAVTNDPATLEGRQPIWRDSLGLIRAYPLFGSGLGTYDTAFLKYQTALVDVDFNFAHNDYLQLITELGLPGALIFLALMGAILIRAFRIAVFSADRGSRAVALGCVGGMAAIAMHSATDFNMYIPPNALLLAWIAGMVAGMPLGTSGAPSQTADAAARRWMRRKLALAMASLLLIYSAASIRFESKYASDPRMEAEFCRFGICDPDLAASPHTRDAYLTVLQREPSAPHRWCDLGESLLRSGDRRQARYCFMQALSLAPEIPPVLIRAAQFYHAIDENELALKQMARILEVSSAYDSTVFGWYSDEKIPVHDILCTGLPEDGRAVQAYLGYVMRAAPLRESAAVWAWALSHRDVTDELARDYVNLLVANKQYQEGAQTWASYIGDRSSGYLKTEWLLDGDFESDTTGLALGWKIANLGKSVTAGLDAGVSHSGKRSLRIDFAGMENVDYNLTQQIAVVTPGIYRFQAFERTSNITTDQGVGLRIFDPESQARVDLRTTPLRGSNEWTRIEQTVRVPPGTRLLTVQVTRRPEWKFDNKISGTAWIDSVSLRKLE